MTPRELQIVEQVIRRTAVEIFASHGNKTRETVELQAGTHADRYCRDIRRALARPARQQGLPEIGTDR